MIPIPGGRIDIEVAPDLKGFDSKLGAGLRQSAGFASSIGRGLGLAVAAGAGIAAVGLKQVIDLGITYQDQLNSLQAVTHATGEQMALVGQRATELGSDMSLPATSAADATSAMLELAKGGLSVDQAMTAAKGTLQLAAAAQIDAAKAAEIQSNALNAFGLSADQAGHVSDVLANAANAASGEITDFAAAFQQAGAIAHQFGLSIDETGTALALLANAGIKGSDAGTLLKSALIALTDTGKPAQKAITDLGLTVYDAQGRFVGLESIFGQLRAASQRMTPELYQQATATLFGSDAMRLAGVAASTTGGQWDTMAGAISRSGGASEVAAAKTKGLGGALEGLKSQAETVELRLFDLIKGPLESLTRGGAGAIATWGNAAVDALSHVHVETDGMSGALHTAEDVVNSLLGAGHNLVNTLRPVAGGLAEVVTSSTQAGGVLHLAGDGFSAAGDGVEVLTGALRPVGALLGGVLGLFASLPGPVQAAVVAMVAFRLAREKLADTALISGFRQFGDEMRVQRALAEASGTSIGTLGAATAAYRTSTVGAVAATRGFTDQVAAIRAGAAAAGTPIGAMAAAAQALGERVGVLGEMGTAFTRASEGATRFGTAAGLAAASGVGLKAAAGGLLGALGGPWGLVIGAAVAGLGLLSAAQQRSAQAAAQHQQTVSSLSGALRESGGVINQQVREQAFLALEQAGAIDKARELGIATRDVTSASLGQAPALAQLRTHLQGIIDADTRRIVDVRGGSGTVTKAYGDQALKAKDLLDAINSQAGATEEAQRRNRELADAMGTSTGSAATLSSAMGTLADETADADTKSRALKDALDALSGGQLGFEEAVGRLNEQIGRLGEGFTQARNQAGGVGQALLNASGGINTSTEAGRALLGTTQSLTQAMAESVTRTYEKVNADQGAAAATAAATAEAQRARDAFVGAAMAAGLNAAQANALADRYGLIPAQVLTLIDAPGAPEVIAEVARIDGQLRNLPRNTPVYVNGLTQEAQARLERLGYTVIHLPNGRVQVFQNGAESVEAAINRAARNRSALITVRYSDSGGRVSGNRPGGSGLAAGGIVAAAYAGGGMALKPMKGGLAQVVAPNTWRIVGDRLRDDEAYIPINRSARSLSILAATAGRMGYALARRFADGAIATRGGDTIARSGVNLTLLTRLQAQATEAGLVRALHRIRLQVEGDGVARLVNKTNLSNRRR